jgi:DNA (cytosine-5)-methyltransferase 1
MTLRIGSLFSGYEGLGMAVTSVLDAEIAWVCDNDPAASKVLAHRYPDVPNLGDITVVDWNTVEPVDIICGGSPCQDISAAGRRLGMKPGTRSGLWTSMATAIDRLRPSLVIFENVRGLLSAPAHCDVEFGPWDLGGPADGEPALRALGRVLGDLADIGFDAEWTGLPASDIGAPHKRWREFLIAWPADADTEHEGRARPAGSGHAQGLGALGEPARCGVGAASDTPYLGRQRGGAAR